MEEVEEVEEVEVQGEGRVRGVEVGQCEGKGANSHPLCDGVQSSWALPSLDVQQWNCSSAATGTQTPACGLVY